MSIHPTKITAACLFLCTSLPLLAATPKEPALSQAQAAHIEQQINTLKSPEERKLASEFSNAKKVAEMICRPLALPVLKQHYKEADRVFLGTDDPTTLTLVSQKLLKGTGQARTGSTWHDFSFACRLNPANGKAIGFSINLTASKKN